VLAATLLEDPHLASSVWVIEPIAPPATVVEVAVPAVAPAAIQQPLPKSDLSTPFA
jgi:hypothetical protein